MERAFNLDAYQFDLATSLPYILAAGTVVAMGAFVALVRGPGPLRYTFLGICGCVLPFVVGYGLNANTLDLAVVEMNSRWCIALTPMAGACVMMFDLSLARKLAQYKRVVAVAIATSAVLAVLSVSTALTVDGAWVTPSGIPFAKAGLLGPVIIATIGLWVIIGSWVLWQSLDTEPSPVRRRQFKGAIWAFMIAALGTVDGLLSFEIGYYPVSWFFLTVGSLVALRSLVADDLVHVQQFSAGGLWTGVYLIAAATGVWFVAERGSAVAVAVAVVALFLLLRVLSGLLGLLGRGDSHADTPAVRALDKYARTVQSARTIEEVGVSTRELFELAIGAGQITLFVPSTADYSWRRADGEVLIEQATPDPLLLGWFVANAWPIARDALTVARLGELREPLERLFDVHQAEVIAPLVNQDELVGLVAIGDLPGGRALRPDETELLSRALEHTRAGVVYARMYLETHARVEVAKEVELAAAVQEAFVPEQAATDYGRIRVGGVYAPASRCGGDWWSSHSLPDDRVLVLIGDVTGHGVAAAMVTAAAKGCCDVALRLMGKDVDVVRLLELLHAAVRRTGGDEFHMTCFATLFDMNQKTITFANAGHVVPYVLRQSNGESKLDVLVARGNPLGASEDPEYVAHTCDVETGDVLVWYTDGIVECTNTAGHPYGDRRFQRALRRLIGEDSDVDELRDILLREALVFHDGNPAADDITLVVGRVM